MPDFAGFGRDIVGRLTADAQQSNTDPNGDPDATDADVREETHRLQALIEARRPPPGPVHGRWSIGIGDVLAAHPRVPDQLRAVVRKLDRYGGLSISEDAVSIDGDHIDWSAVTEIRTQNVVEYLLSGAVDEQLGSLPVPWFPGRRKLLNAASTALLTMLVATAKDQLDRHQDVRIPAEIRYRGTLRNRQLSPGILATLMLADPNVNDCLQSTARAHGVTITSADTVMRDTADQRAARLRSQLAGLEARLGRSSVGTAAPLQAPPPTAAPAPDLPPPPPPPTLPTDGSQPLFAPAVATTGSTANAGYPQINAGGYPQIGVSRPSSGGQADRSAGLSGPARRPSPQQWALIAAALLAVIALVAVTVSILTGPDSGPTAAEAVPAPKWPGTAAEVPACSDAPSVTAQSITDGSGGLTFDATIATTCSAGDVLSDDEFRITVADSLGRDVAAGVFDLSDNPISVQENGTSVTFVFPPGTYWRTAGAITGSVRMDGYEDGRSSSGGGAGTGTAFTAISPAAPASGDLDAAAHSALVDIAIADRAYIDANLLNLWQPQLSSKRPGLFADGISWNYPEIVREHLQLRQRFPTARLVWSGDWPVFTDPSWWVTVTGTPFRSGEDALGWCASEGFDRDHCLAKILSHNMDTTGTTLLRP